MRGREGGREGGEDGICLKEGWGVRGGIEVEVLRWSEGRY